MRAKASVPDFFAHDEIGQQGYALVT